jgi:hypothetical protein
MAFDELLVGVLFDVVVVLDGEDGDGDWGDG